MKIWIVLSNFMLNVTQYKVADELRGTKEQLQLLIYVR